MKAFPHVYVVRAGASAEGEVTLASAGVPDLPSAAPKEFDGPGDRWSPEVLLLSSVVSCFVLTFRAIAKASKLEWTSLRCEAEGVLDRVERVTRFTEMQIRAVLDVPAGVDRDAALRLLEKAEKGCLVTNSLNAHVVLRAEVTTSVEGGVAAG